MIWWLPTEVCTQILSVKKVCVCLWLWLKMCLCFCLYDDLTFGKQILPQRLFHPSVFHFRVTFFEALAENTSISPDAGCQMAMMPVEWPGLLFRVAVFNEGWPFQKEKRRKKKKNAPQVQMWGWVNPSVLSFHVEVMLSKSFCTRLPGWRDGCLGVISEYPCSWSNQTSWLLEIKLLRLHVGSWIKVEGSSLSSVGDQAGIFVNL